MSKTALESAYRSLIQRHRLSPDPGQAALITRLGTLHETLITTQNGGTYSETPRGVYIHGGVGTGKSRIADLFAVTLPDSISRRRIHFYEFMMDIHSRLHIARSQSHFPGDPLVQIGAEVRRESQVLCFDEFQVTDIADAMILRRLFGSIWRHGGVLVSTSNRHPDRLYENGLNRDLFVPFIAELKRHCEVWKISGELDYRMKGSTSEGKRVESFFLDRDRFSQSLDDQLDGNALQSDLIDVPGGRQMHIRMANRPNNGHKLVRTTFEELCQANRGSADYFALCQKVKLIYISGLRRFRKDELDVVRRFITLIDLAYEARVRVFCLSDVPLVEVFENIVAPKDLPVEGLLQRQVSRNMTVRGEGGSSSSMMTTFIGETEWSATGLSEASLATGGAGETDVRFAIGRAVSRLFEMGSTEYGSTD